MRYDFLKIQLIKIDLIKQNKMVWQWFLRQYLIQEKSLKTKTIVEYYLKTEKENVYFLKETTKIEGNRCIVIVVKRYIAFETYSSGYCLNCKGYP